MNFDFSEEQLFIRDQARNFLAQECPAELVRSSLESDQPFDAGLWQQIVDLGWTGIAIPEDNGGLGLGYLELCMIAEELGRSLAPVPYSSSVYLATEALKTWGSDAQRNDYLPRLAAGDIRGTLAHAEGMGKTSVAAHVADGKLSATKLPVPDGDSADFAIVTAHNASGELDLYIADLHASGVARTPIQTVDPSRSQAQLTFTEAPVEVLGGATHGAQTLAELLDRAAVLIAFEQTGGCQAAMDMGIAYTKERYAFGRPVASFQAIKHKFADMYVALELARANSYYGAWALSSDAPDLALAAATARVSATDAYYLISKENIQAHGGMGFTWEFDCHLYYRRAHLLASMIGSQPQWKDELASRLLAA